MDVVIDAQILGWYYQAVELGKSHPCSAEPDRLFERLGDGDHGLLDSGEHIEAEWRRVADSDWFDEWLFTQLTTGTISIIDIDTCGPLLRKLEIKCGFPRSGDRTAATRAAETGVEVALISEDVDLFDPKVKKDSTKRKRVLEACSGCVAGELRRADVTVRTVARHLG